MAALSETSGEGEEDGVEEMSTEARWGGLGIDFGSALAITIS